MGGVFGLTSVWTLVAAGMLLATVLGWAIVRLPRQQVSLAGAMIRQAVALLLSSILTVLLVGLALNRANDWYPTWSDLPGMGSGQVVVQGSPGPQEQVPPADLAVGTATPLQSDPARNRALVGYDPTAPHGQYLSVTIPGPVSGISQPALVWLPASYASHPERFYPVVLALHGAPGSPDTYRDQLQIGETLSSLTNDHAIREAIVVAPTVFDGDQDGECVDGTTGPGPLKWETYVDTDVRNWALANLRTVEHPGGWVTVGYSAGGFCAAMFPVRHPDHYAQGVVLSGYFSPEFSPGKRYLPVGDPTYDLGRIVRQDTPPVALFAYAARDDRSAMSALAAFSGAVAAPTTLTTQLQETGGHSMGVWAPGLHAGLQWLGASAAQFAWVAS